MTLIGAILKQAKLKNKKCSSPPPEMEKVVVGKKKKPVYKYAHVRSVVDTSAPPYDAARLPRPLPQRARCLHELRQENLRLVTKIKMMHFNRGKVDSRWVQQPPLTLEYYHRRARFYRRLQLENRDIYKRILQTKARVVTTKELHRDWSKNRQEIISRAQAKFVLFPPVPQELVEDAAFLPPPGVKWPRVYMTLRIRGGAVLGELQAELFTDVCPQTTRLFLQLLDGDGLGHGYVGTCFFRKVPGLYWTGGDVIYDNGFGCYAQPGLRVPIGAENYHFSHSMPGLLSMRVTCDDEMCGVFNITFKPIQQFDLHSVVFGRIIRPCATFSAIQALGSALSARPAVEIASARRRGPRRWVRGTRNTRVVAKRQN